MKEFIKLDDDRYLIKNSNGKIVSKKDVIIQDIVSNECVKDLYKGELKSESKPIKKTKQVNTTNNKSEHR